MSSIRGTIDAERFIIIGYRLGSIQQNKIINEIIQIYTNQIKNGWQPRFDLYSIIFYSILYFVEDQFYFVLGLV